MPRIEITTEIDAPAEIVFDLARSIDLHQTSQAKYRERAVAGRTSGLIEAGEQVTWEAVHLGVRQRLCSRIISMRRPAHFRDIMVSGPFERFEHDHFFETRPDGGTTMKDVFDYSAPFGPLGRLADELFLERYLRTLLVERNCAIKNQAETRAGRSA